MHAFKINQYFIGIDLVLMFASIQIRLTDAARNGYNRNKYCISSHWAYEAEVW